MPAPWGVRCLWILVFLLQQHTAWCERYCGAADCYEILGLNRNAELPEIKKSYRKLSMQWHPDKNRDNKAEATAKFQGIATAYEVLSDSSLREAYDYFLDHPEQDMYNTVRYYRATVKTPLWTVILGFLLVFSCLQYAHQYDRARSFMSGPQLRILLEAENVSHCRRGRQGYQSGELSETKRAEIRQAFLARLRKDPDCPLAQCTWTNTLIPWLLYKLPASLCKWILWRISNHGQIQEEKRSEYEARWRAKEEQQAFEEEAARLEIEKAEQKALKAKLVEERKQEEERKRRRWAEEAKREAEEQELCISSRDLEVSGHISSVDELRKKGNFLVEVTYGEGGLERVQVVTDRPVQKGQSAKVALEGATLPTGKKVLRSKIAGEWSEGVLLKLGHLPSVDDGADKDKETCTCVDDTCNDEAARTIQRKKRA